MFAEFGHHTTVRVFLFRHFIHGGDTSSYSCMRNICMYSLSVSTQCYNSPSKNSGAALTRYAGVLLFGGGRIDSATDSSGPLYY